MNDLGRAPKVTVLMPVYNGARYLAAAVESILRQSYADFELLCLDDGSTDDSWSMLQGYAGQDGRLRLAQNPANLGLIQTLNRGLALARGEYIARMDADDIALPERLAQQVAFLEQHHEVGFVGSAYYRMHTDGTHTLRTPPLEHSGLRWAALFGTPICHPTALFRRSLYEQGALIYRDFPHVEDFDLFVRLLRVTRAAVLAAPLYLYREHGTSVSAVHADFQFRLGLTISARQMEELLGRTLPPSEVEAIYHCHAATRPLSTEELAQVATVFDLFRGLGPAPDVDAGVLHAIRRGWIRRLLAVGMAAHYRTRSGSDSLRQILRNDPWVLARAGLVEWPRRAARHARKQHVKPAQGGMG